MQFSPLSKKVAVKQVQTKNLDEHAFLLELSSPKNGRPLPLKERRSSLSTLSLDLPSLEVEAAFDVPQTPPMRLGKRSGKTVLFPDAEDQNTRHNICQFSLAPWTYLLNIPGKNIRDALIDAFNFWLDCSRENIALIKQIVGYEYYY